MRAIFNNDGYLESWSLDEGKGFFDSDLESIVPTPEDLDVDRLEKAINSLISRHESLRTHFENRDGQVVQVINEEASIEVIKLESDKPDNFIRPFDLRKAPLIRAGYYENTVMIDIHHIIADGSSVAVFFKELNELYMGRELKETVQYGEFAVTDSYTEENEKYWLNTFSEEPTTLELPTDYQRADIQGSYRSRYYCRVRLWQSSFLKEKRFITKFTVTTVSLFLSLTA